MRSICGAPCDRLGSVLCIEVAWLNLVKTSWGKFMDSENSAPEAPPPKQDKLVTALKLEDLEAARVELANVQRRWDNYSGNNPDKYKTDIRQATEKVQSISDILKLAKIIALTPEEELFKVLDAAFPKAQSKEVVSYNGLLYERKFTPGGKSRSGKTVTSWLRSWVVTTAKKP